MSRGRGGTRKQGSSTAPSATSLAVLSRSTSNGGMDDLKDVGFPVVGRNSRYGQSAGGVESGPEMSLASQLDDDGIPYVTQYFFSPYSRHRADFFINAGKTMIVEVQGGTRIPSSGHTSGDGYLRDCRKMAMAQILGHQVLYVTSEQVYSGEAMVLIRKILGAG